MKKKIIMFAAGVAISLSIQAGSFEEGKAAYSKKDYLTAISKFRDLAQKGHAPSQIKLIEIYDRKEGLPKDEGKRERWLLDAMRSGDSIAKLFFSLKKLDSVFSRGKPISDDILADAFKALDVLKAASDDGIVISNLILGEYYDHLAEINKENPRDGRVALLSWYGKTKSGGEWYQVAYRALQNPLNNGYPESQRMLAQMNWDGQGTPMNARKALDLWKMAAGQGDLESIRRLAYAYTGDNAKEKGVAKDSKEVAKWRALLADSDNPHMKYLLAEDYQYGKGGLDKDEYQALIWYRKAAEAGHPESAYRLGRMAANETGAYRDNASILKWYKRGADLGDKNAQYEMGAILEAGEVLPQDFKGAFNYYKKSAVQGNEIAQQRLSAMYLVGRGVSNDDVKAYMWSVISISNSDYKPVRDKLIEYRESILKYLTSSQVNQAQLLARKCLDSKYNNCQWP